MSLATVHLVNTTVSSVSKSTLLPWTILQIKEEDHTVQDFFELIIKPRLSFSLCDLHSAQVGKEKGLLDHVDINLPLVAVISSFGHYLKYFVDVACISPSTNISTETTMVPVSSIIHPIYERNKKDKLFNDILNFFDSFTMTIEEASKDKMKRLIAVFQSIFWHIDGHHHVFEQRALGIPSIFSIFSGYNVPERSKHRKRVTSNLSCDVLQEVALELSTLLNFSFWDKGKWPELKPHFQDLLGSLSSYVDYLVQKNKRMKVDHRSPTPVRDLSSNLHLKYIASCEETNDSPLALASIEDRLHDMQCFEVLHISNLLPTNRIQRHRVINSLVSSGLSYPTILLVYSPGSNIGNLHFLWKVPDDTTISDCFEQSVTSIESAKQQLPVFHTRAMRQEMFTKIGRVSQAVKPSVLRYFYKSLTGKNCHKFHSVFNLFL